MSLSRVGSRHEFSFFQPHLTLLLEWNVLLIFPRDFNSFFLLDVISAPGRGPRQGVRGWQGGGGHLTWQSKCLKHFNNYVFFSELHNCIGTALCFKKFNSIPTPTTVMFNLILRAFHQALLVLLLAHKSNLLTLKNNEWTVFSALYTSFPLCMSFLNDVTKVYSFK